MANTKTTLIASFALFALIGLYVLVDNGASLLQLAFVALSIITVVALTENAGEWARILAILFSGFILLASVAMMVFVLVRFLDSSSASLFAIVAAPIIGVIAALTLRTLLVPASRSDNRAY
jgi:cytochrome bd-type quinol oxidase subunit 2